MLLNQVFPKNQSFLDIKGLKLDSRKVVKGDLFFAFKGSQQDGRDYIEQALQQGALAIVYDPEDYQLADTIVSQHPCAEFIAVEHLQHQLSSIAGHFYQEPANSLRLIGVTGTNGKTTVTQLIAQALDLLSEHCGIIGTLGTGFWSDLQQAKQTTPDAITIQESLADLLTKGARTVALEVSSHGLDQGRVEALPFKVAVFTNLTRDHLDYHHTLENYGAAKAQLFTWDSLDRKIINQDDPFGQQLIQLNQGQDLLTFSLEDETADLYCENIEFSEYGIKASLVSPQGKGLLQTKLVGRFNLSNLLAVVGSLLGLGYDLATVLMTIPKLNAPAGRMQREGGDGKPTVVIDYAHTPDALEQVLTALRPHVKNKLWCVFGCGGSRDKGKRVAMAEIAERLADNIVITDDNPREESSASIIEDILQGFNIPQAVSVIADRKQAIWQTVERAAANDVILVAGKGHEDYQEVMGKRTHFSDFEEVSKALQAWENNK